MTAAPYRLGRAAARRPWRFVAVGMAGLLLASNLVGVSSTAPTPALMIGLAVGIDYALFIVSRHRAELAGGAAVGESIARSVATAGSAVVFAGATVVIALVGLTVVGIDGSAPRTEP